MRLLKEPLNNYRLINVPYGPFGKGANLRLAIAQSEVAPRAFAGNGQLHCQEVQRCQKARTARPVGVIQSFLNQ